MSIEMEKKPARFLMRGSGDELSTNPIGTPAQARLYNVQHEYTALTSCHQPHPLPLQG